MQMSDLFFKLFLNGNSCIVIARFPAFLKSSYHKKTGTFRKTGLIMSKSNRIVKPILNDSFLLSCKKTPKVSNLLFELPVIKLNHEVMAKNVSLINRGTLHA